MAGYGTAAGTDIGFIKSFDEHCIVIALMSSRSQLTYQEGLHRFWTKQTKQEEYWPALAHLGEQSVLNQEIYADNSANDTLVFGYQERYSEYRYKPSQVSGLFRSAATGTLDSWHLSQQFGSLPTLNSTFLTENPPMTRIKATAGDPDFICDAFFELRCTRPMPLHGVPGYIDHF